MKITREVYTPVQDRKGKRWPLVTYRATNNQGLYGFGSTPEKAVLDLRHEIRSFRDSAEQGKCRQGRFHKW